LNFFVKDTGIGIPIEQQSTVLKDLYRSISKTFRHVRARFRLAISKAFVQLLGGEIWQPGRNRKRLLFSLPLAVKIKERSRKRTEFKNENCAQKKIKNADCR
jgi:signal transduction histidine kinase